MTITNIDAILNERGKNYGDFAWQAKVAQSLMEAVRQHDNWDVLKPFHKEALTMIFSKIGRIVNGDPDYQDSWDDIAGYATLVSNIIYKNIKDIEAELLLYK